MDLALPGPSAEQRALAAGLTLSAPDHGGLRPFRLRVVGDSWREVLSDLAAMGAQQRGQTAEEVERTGVRAFNGTGLAALGTPVRDDVPPHEQWLRVGAALMDCFSALQLMGFVAEH